MKKIIVLSVSLLFLNNLNAQPNDTPVYKDTIIYKNGVKYKEGWKNYTNQWLSYMEYLPDGLTPWCQYSYTIDQSDSLRRLKEIVYQYYIEPRFPNLKPGISSTHHGYFKDLDHFIYDGPAEVYMFNDSAQVEKLTYKNGIKEGQDITYVNGKLFQFNCWKDGSWNGMYATIDINSNMITSAGNFKNNFRIGQWVWYYPDGRIKETGLYDTTGIHVQLNTKSRIMTFTGIDRSFIKQQQFSMAFLDSVVANFPDDEGGVQFRTFPMNIPNRLGEWKFYDQTGKLTQVEFYEKGKLIRKETY